MIVYGLINSKFQELYVKAIIYSFVKRSFKFLLFYYYNIHKREKISPISNEDLKPLFELFIAEEKMFTPKSFENINNKNYNLYLLLLSSNIIVDKDYNFEDKTTAEIIKDGEKNIENVFYDTIREIFSDVSSNKSLSILLETIEEKITSIMPENLYVLKNEQITTGNVSKDQIFKIITKEEASKIIQDFLDDISRIWTLEYIKKIAKIKNSYSGSSYLLERDNYYRQLKEQVKTLE